MGVRRRRRGAVAAMVAIIVFSAMIFALVLSWEESTADIVQRNVQNTGLDVLSAYNSSIEAARSHTVSQIGIWDMDTEDPDDDDMLFLRTWGTDGQPHTMSVPQDLMFSVAETWPCHNRVWNGPYGFVPPVQEFYLSCAQDPVVSLDRVERAMDTTSFARNMAQWKHAWYGFTGPDHAGGIYTFNEPITTGLPIEYPDTSAWQTPLVSLHPLIALHFDDDAEFATRTANAIGGAGLPEAPPAVVDRPAYTLALQHYDTSAIDHPLLRIEAVDLASDSDQDGSVSATTGNNPNVYRTPTYHLLRFDEGYPREGAGKGLTLLRTANMVAGEDCFWTMGDSDNPFYIGDEGIHELHLETVTEGGIGSFGRQHNYGMAGDGTILSGGTFLENRPAVPASIRPTSALNLHFWVRLDETTPRDDQLVLHMADHFALGLLSSGELRWSWNTKTDLTEGWTSRVSTAVNADWSEWHHIAINQKLVTVGSNRVWRTSCVVDGVLEHYWSNTAGTTASNPRMGDDAAPDFWHVGGSNRTLSGLAFQPTGTVYLDELHYRNASFPVFDNRSVSGLVPGVFPGDPNATGSGRNQRFASRFVEDISGTGAGPFYTVTDDFLRMTSGMPGAVWDDDPEYYDLMDTGFTIEMYVTRNPNTSWPSTTQRPIVMKTNGHGTTDANWAVKLSTAGQVYFNYSTTGGSSYGVAHPGLPYPPNSGDRLEPGQTRFITITGERRSDGRLHYFIAVDGDVYAQTSLGNTIRRSAGDFLVDADSNLGSNGVFWIDDLRISSAFSPEYASDYTVPDHSVHSLGAMEFVSEYPATSLTPPEDSYGRCWRIGHGAYVELPNPHDGSEDGFTFEAWVKREDSEASGSIAGIYDNTRPTNELGWFISIDPNGEVWFRFTLANGTEGGNRTGITIPPGEWRYLTFVYERATKRMWCHAGYPDALANGNTGSAAFPSPLGWFGRLNSPAPTDFDVTTPLRIGKPYRMSTVYDRPQGYYPGSDILIHTPVYKPYIDTSYRELDGIHPPFTESALMAPAAQIEDLPARLAGLSNDPRGASYNSGDHWLEAGRDGFQVPDPGGNLLEPEDGFSAQFWLYQESAGEWGGMVAHKWAGRLDSGAPAAALGDSCNSFYIKTRPDGLGGGQIELGVQVKGQRLRRFYGPAGMRENTAHHVVVVYDPVLENVSIGVDGSFQHYQGNKFASYLTRNRVALEIGGNRLLGSPPAVQWRYWIDDFQYFPHPLREFYAFPARNPITAPYCRPPAPLQTITSWITEASYGIRGTSAANLHRGHLSFAPPDPSVYWWDPVRRDSWQLTIKAMVNLGTAGQEYVILSNWREFDDKLRYKIGVNRNNELYFAFSDDGTRASMESCYVSSLRKLTTGRWHEIIVAFDKWSPDSPSPFYLGVGEPLPTVVPPGTDLSGYDVDVAVYSTHAWLTDLEEPGLGPPFTSFGGPAVVGGKAAYDITGPATSGSLRIDGLVVLNEFDPLLCTDGREGLLSSDSLYSAANPVRVADSPFGAGVGDPRQASTHSYDFDPAEGENYYLGNWDHSDVITAQLPYKVFVRDYGDDFSMKFWCKVQGVPPFNRADGRHIVVSKWSDLVPGKSFKVELNPYPGDNRAVQLTWTLSSDGSDEIVYTWPDKISIDTWHHVYLGFQDGRVTANVDGTIEVADLSASLTSVFESAAPLYMGRTQTERPSDGTDKMLLNELVMQMAPLPWFERDRLGPDGWVPASRDVPGRPLPLHRFPRYDYHCGPDAATVPPGDGGPHMWRGDPLNTEVLDRCIELAADPLSADPAAPEYLIANLPERYATLQAFTFDFWVNIGPAGGAPRARAIVSHGSSYLDNFGTARTSDGWEIFTYRSGKTHYLGVDLRAVGDVTTGDPTFLRAPVTTDTWHHVALVFDGYDKSSGDSMWYLFLDGFEVATYAGPLSELKLFGCPLWIGCSGLRDDLRAATRVEGAPILVDQLRYLDRAVTEWRLGSGGSGQVFDPDLLLHHRVFDGIPTTLSLSTTNSLGFSVFYEDHGGTNIPRIDSWVKTGMSRVNQIDVERRGSYSGH